jgi:hypothetical protein
VNDPSKADFQVLLKSNEKTQALRYKCMHMHIYLYVYVHTHVYIYVYMCLFILQDFQVLLKSNEVTQSLGYTCIILYICIYMYIYICDVLYAHMGNEKEIHICIQNIPDFQVLLKSNEATQSLKYTCSILYICIYTYM